MTRTAPAAGPASLVGRHVLAELAGVDAALLDDQAALREALTGALVAAGADVRQVVVEAFEPHGVTMVALLAESHASVHTWPEHGTAHVDVFTCGASADPVRAVDLLAAALGATAVHREVIGRGAGAYTVVEAIAPGLARRWDVGAVHHAARTPYQQVLIADTAHGVTLFCDDERQSAETTQLTYHEALFVPAALLAARRDRVLVIGSSEGVVSELAVAVGATLVDHVDIDRDCVRACAEHLPYGYSPDRLVAAEHHRGPVRMHYADGMSFVEESTDRYDIVVVDLPDERPDEPDAQLNRLYTASFLTRCRDLVGDDGVVVSQAGSPALWRDETLRAACTRFHDVFGQVVPYTSDEHEWTFLAGRATAGPDPVGEMTDRLTHLPAPPASIDATALRARSVLPFRLRSAQLSGGRSPSPAARRGCSG
jgi:spermidine synthase